MQTAAASRSRPTTTPWHARGHGAAARPRRPVARVLRVWPPIDLASYADFASYADSPTTTESLLHASRVFASATTTFVMVYCFLQWMYYRRLRLDHEGDGEGDGEGGSGDDA